MPLILILMGKVEYKRTGLQATLLSIYDLSIYHAAVKLETFNILEKLYDANYSTTGPSK